MTLNDRSEKNLSGVHPTLVAVVRRAAELMTGDLGFVVTEGLRTRARQAQLVAAGASQTMNSKHLTGHAVDLAATLNGAVRWDWPLYGKLNAAMQAAAQEQSVVLTWGGGWSRLRDGPHWEINPKDYPIRST